MWLWIWIRICLIGYVASNGVVFERRCIKEELCKQQGPDNRRDGSTDEWLKMPLFVHKTYLTFVSRWFRLTWMERKPFALSAVLSKILSQPLQIQIRSQTPSFFKFFMNGLNIFEWWKKKTLNSKKKIYIFGFFYDIK